MSTQMKQSVRTSANDFQIPVEAVQREPSGREGKSQHSSSACSRRSDGNRRHSACIRLLS